MNACGPNSQGGVNTGVDEQTSCQLAVLNSQGNVLADDLNRLAGQSLQFPCTQVFLAQLDEVHGAAGGFGDLLQQTAAALRLAAGELGAVGDVVEQQVDDFI